MAGIEDGTPPEAGSPATRPEATRAHRGGLAVSLALAALSFAVHWPLRSRFLATWDSVLFALALDDFDVLAARPHPPGYPVYVAMARVVAWGGGSPNATLVLLSLLCAAGTVGLLHAFLRRIGSPRAALVGAGLFALAPVLAKNSAIATSYPGEALFSVATAYAAWHHAEGPGPRRAALLGGVFLLALGFRLSLAFFLTPLVAWALLRRPWDAAWLRRAAAASGAGLAVGLAWLVPLVRESHGWRSYRAATALQTEHVVFAHTVFQDGREAWDELWARFALYLRFEAWGLLPWAALILGGAAWWGWRRGAPWWRTVAGPRWMPLFFALWLLPPTLFYLTVFNGWGSGPDGYILVLLPGLYALYGLLGDAAVSSLPIGGGRRLAAVAGAALLLVPGPGLAAGWGDALQEVRDHDGWAASWLALDAEFPPSDTALLASYSWAHAKWHHPDHVLWSALDVPRYDGTPAHTLTIETRHREDDVSFYEAHLRGPTGATHPIPPGVTRVVLYDFQIAGENDGRRLLADDVEVREAHLSNGWRVLWFATEPGRPTIESYFAVPPNQPAP